jgi:hypothetical protein
VTVETNSADLLQSGLLRSEAALIPPKKTIATRLGPMIPLRAVQVGLARTTSEWYANPCDIQAIARHHDAHDELREASVEAAGS